MPWWTGCRILNRDDVFLLNPDVPLSFDGRYFGVVDRSLIIGKAQAL
jgi:type IV secretory pathway protease TraF